MCRRILGPLEVSHDAMTSGAPQLTKSGNLSLAEMDAVNWDDILV